MSIKEAFSSGVEPGGLYAREDIQLLICYMLMSVDAPMPRQDVLDIVSGGGMANLFETGAAIDELVQRGTLTEENDLLKIQESGRQAARMLYNRLPYTLRERSVKAAMQLLARRRNERESSIQIEELENGILVTCTIHDGPSPLMAVSLRVADQMQAQMIREKFLDNPTLVYRSLIAMLTGNAGMYMENSRIVIDLK